MTEDLNKTVVVDEADPEKLKERANDAPGSFLDLYRSLSQSHVPQDEKFVDASVIEGVIPESVRYGIMQRGPMTAFRGVVKSTSGDLFYFNWHDGADFKLVPADNPTKQWEAAKLIKSCRLGCDLIRSAPKPAAGHGHPVDGRHDTATAPLEDSEMEDVEKDIPGAAVAPVSEEEWMQQQQRMMHEVHPGDTAAQTPDDPTQGRNWHANEQIARAQDGMQALATNDGVKHWTASDLLKAWGQQMQQSAPTVQPRASSLETEYMKTVLNVPDVEIQKGVQLAPRHRLGFEQWKAHRLRGSLTRLQSWAKGDGTT
jgi:hypothetical protein